ncbi:DUF2809 domain-containing protein [Massilia sp. B-10]|nr:DUF2809 domain-containing protein [Massilia sp. B-10]
MDSWPLAWLALAIAWADEFAQLIQWPWLAALRKTTPGHLILGSGFDWVDLIAYAVGIAVAATIDQLLREGAVRLRSPKMNGARQYGLTTVAPGKHAYTLGRDVPMAS